MTPRVGLWGPFGKDDLEGALAIRVTDAELRRRLPTLRCAAYSPGADGPRTLDPERRLRPLGHVSAERAAEMAGELDGVLVVGGLNGRGTGTAEDAFLLQGLGAELEVRCPVIWHAVQIHGDLDGKRASRARRLLTHRPYVSVRDELSRRRLQAAGVDREVVVVPHPALLAPRSFSTAVLDRRLAHLRLVGHLPHDRGTLVVEDDASLRASAAPIARGLAGALELRGDLEVVVVETAGAAGDDTLATRLEEALPGRVRRFPAAPVEDLIALVADARCVVAANRTLAAVAVGYGRPVALLEMQGGQDGPAAIEPLDARIQRVDSAERLAGAVERLLGRPAAAAGLPAALTAQLDAHFDRIGDVVERAAWERRAVAGGTGPGAGDGPGAEPSSELREARRTLALLRRAHRRRLDDLGSERAEHIDATERARLLLIDRDEQIERSRLRLAQLEHRVTTLEAGLAERRARVDQLLVELGDSRAAQARQEAQEGRLGRLRQKDARYIELVSAELERVRAEADRASQLAAQLAESRELLDQMLRSRSWRLLAPVRALAALRRGSPPGP